MPETPDAPRLDVLIPTRNRPVELATTLSGLAAQDHPSFRVVVSDQSDDTPSYDTPAARSVARVLGLRGVPVLFARNLPRRGMAQQRAHLLSRARAAHVLFLDDDVWLEPGTLSRLHAAITRLGCGFVGAALTGLSYVDDHRPHQLEPFEEWAGPVLPEVVTRDSAAWQRWTLHNAANPLHLAQRLALAPGEWRAYKVAWVGGCVLFDRAALLDCGGFDFWPDLPAAHAGEDVRAQLAVMSRYGGAGILPSGAVHLESPTTVTDRSVEAMDVRASP
ncbi:glycosyltransferase family 2 protein [Actinokineospora bangkokensis]|uniref:glycosyltransferase family 2 protein n=1 Tax=Actinokineospora bangkokensis TaxID=1193682 RepID=UPI000B06BE16|nr:glycosyltransferase family 2 protein [Actinokineospora bangkokensis]